MQGNKSNSECLVSCRYLHCNGTFVFQMPRAAFVTVDEAVNLVTRYAENFQSSKFPRFSSKVWVDMSDDCDNKWSPTNIYINVT